MFFSFSLAPKKFRELYGNYMGTIWELYGELCGNYMGTVDRRNVVMRTNAIFLLPYVKWAGLFFPGEILCAHNALRSVMRTNFASKSCYAYKACFVRMTEGTCAHDATKFMVRITEGTCTGIKLLARALFPSSPI